MTECAQTIFRKHSFSAKHIMANNNSLKLHKYRLFGPVPKSPIQIGLLSLKKLGDEFLRSHLGTFTGVNPVVESTSSLFSYLLAFPLANADYYSFEDTD